jgi:uncharacterized protein (TIGR02246 family)
MTGAGEGEIRELLDEMTDAWNRGDAEAYGARYQSDATLTNAFGVLHAGREAFLRRHEEIFRGIFKGTRLAMEIRKLRFLRPDVVALDVGVMLAGARVRPPGVEVGVDGSLRSSLLLVLTSEGGRWEIAAYHNVWRAGAF